MRALFLRRGFALVCTAFLLVLAGCVAPPDYSKIAVPYVGIRVPYAEFQTRFQAEFMERSRLKTALENPAFSAEAKQQERSEFTARQVARIRSALVLNPGDCASYIGTQIGLYQQEWAQFVNQRVASLEQIEEGAAKLTAEQDGLVKAVFADQPEHYEAYLRQFEKGRGAAQAFRHGLEVRRLEASATALSAAQAAQAVAPVKDQVLWHYRVGVLALREGNRALARAELDAALARTGGLLSTAGAGAEARKLFNEEAAKGFVGEPYERVMASFYRGLIYWMDGEPDNARALFRTGAFIDSDTEEKTYAADWVSLDYLDGLVTNRLAGGEAGESELARARSNHLGQFPGTPRTMAAYAPESTVLVVVEYGAAPVKAATGEYKEKLVFERGQPFARAVMLQEAVKVGLIKPEHVAYYQGNVYSPLPNITPVGGVRLEVDGRPVPLPTLDDLYFQASTRGGRAMDYVLGNKAVFKKTGGAVGDGMMVGGLAALGGGGDNAVLGLGLVAIGATTKAITRAIKTQADTRTWDNLPECLAVAQLALAPGDHPARLLVYSMLGRLIEERTQEFTITVPVPAAGEPTRDLIVFRSDVKG